MWRTPLKSLNQEKDLSVNNILKIMKTFENYENERNLNADDWCSLGDRLCTGGSIPYLDNQGRNQ